MLGIYEFDTSRLSELNLQLKLKRVKGVMRRSLSSSSLLRDLKVHGPGSKLHAKVHGPGSKLHTKVHGPGSKLHAKVHGPGSKLHAKVHPGQDKVIS